MEMIRQIVKGFVENMRLRVKSFIVLVDDEEGRARYLAARFFKTVFLER